MIEVEVDQSARYGTHKQMTFAVLRDIRGDIIPWPGTLVLAVDKNSDLAAPAIVIAYNRASQLLYLTVAWRDMRERAHWLNSPIGAS